MMNRYVYKLKDDLEAFIYIVLYCALRWLPVTSDRSLKWWLNEFFSVGPTPWTGGPAKKEINAYDRTFTKGLKSKTSIKVLEWLNAAMDLHHGLRPNPLWDDGEALGNMWRRSLEDDIPNNDRRKDKAHSTGFRDIHPICATFTVQPLIRLRKNAQRSAHSPISAKRPRPSCDGRAEDSPPKRCKPTPTQV